MMLNREILRKDAHAHRTDPGNNEQGAKQFLPEGFVDEVGARNNGDTYQKHGDVKYSRRGLEHSAGGRAGSSEVADVILRDAVTWIEKFRDVHCEYEASRSYE